MMIFWLVLKLEISYNRVMIIWRILDFGFLLEKVFEDCIFVMVKDLNFHNSSFAWRYFVNVNGKGHTPLVYITPNSTLG